MIHTSISFLVIECAVITLATQISIIAVMFDKAVHGYR